jgi:hypothetical protein
LLVFLIAFGTAGAPVQAQQSVVKLGGTQPCASGSDVVVPVQLFPADGLTDMDFVFNYDQAALSPTGSIEPL